MHALWHWLLWMLAATASDPADLTAERARGAGCVTVAYSSLVQDLPQPSKPETTLPAKESPACVACGGTGRIYRPDGGWVKCSCSCQNGRCPTTKR